MYISLFFNFRKLKTPFQKCIFTVISPDFEFGLPVNFWHVYQCIHCVYIKCTTSKRKTAAKFLQTVTSSSTYCHILTCKLVLRPPRIEIGWLKDLLTRRNARMESKMDSNRCHMHQNRGGGEKKELESAHNINNTKND